MIVATTWNISFEKLNEEARQLLYLFSHLAPEKIPLELFTEHTSHLPQPLQDAMLDELDQIDVFTALKEYSLVVENVDEELNKKDMSIHRLVQEVLINDSSNDYKYTLYCLDLIIEALPKSYFNSSSVETFKRISTHAHIVENEIKAKNNIDEVNKQIGQMNKEMGEGYYITERHSESLRCLLSALAIYERIYGPFSEEIADIWW
jgi:hypothetical protein